ncbi:unnamed protein product [Caenorhabditis auriculariae]|uniref:Uncharacterized protein n=1 Tax=Caenorhabditis auriculariae TaxID=2777116 RepID=A0A8S1GMK0_9PELO|nr:unnamed protein product [Caenorhabditis auriculariae]
MAFAACFLALAVYISSFSTLVAIRETQSPCKHGVLKDSNSSLLEFTPQEMCPSGSFPTLVHYKQVCCKNEIPWKTVNENLAEIRAIKLHSKGNTESFSLESESEDEEIESVFLPVGTNENPL